MNLSSLSERSIQQAVVILEGDELVIPEVVRAINSKIKQRYKVCDAENVVKAVCFSNSIIVLSLLFHLIYFSLNQHLRRNNPISNLMDYLLSEN